MPTLGHLGKWVQHGFGLNSALPLTGYVIVYTLPYHHSPQLLDLKDGAHVTLPASQAAASVKQQVNGAPASESIGAVAMWSVRLLLSNLQCHLLRCPDPIPSYILQDFPHLATAPSPRSQSLPHKWLLSLCCYTHSDLPHQEIPEECSPLFSK